MVVTQFYDPMIAKLIATGDDRDAALARLARALGETAVAGVRTNLPLLRALVAHPDVQRNAVHTGSVAPITAGLTVTRPADPMEVAIAAALWLRAARGRASTAWRGWGALSGWRQRAGEDAVHQAPVLRLSAGDSRHAVGFGAVRSDGALPVVVDDERVDVRLPEAPGAVLLVEAAGCVRSLTADCGADRVAMILGTREIVLKVEPFLSGTLLAGAQGADDEVRAPMMGQIIAVDVAAGQ